MTDCEVFLDSSFDMFEDSTVESDVPAEVTAERLVDTFPEATADEKELAAEVVPDVLLDTFVEKPSEMYARGCASKPCSSDGEGMRVNQSWLSRW